MGDEGGAFVVGLIFGLTVSIFGMAKTSEYVATDYIRQVRKEAIERGYGAYKTDSSGKTWYEWK